MACTAADPWELDLDDQRQDYLGLITPCADGAQTRAFVVIDIQMMTAEPSADSYWDKDLSNVRMTPTSIYFSPSEFVPMKVLSRSRDGTIIVCASDARIQMLRLEEERGSAWGLYQEPILLPILNIENVIVTDNEPVPIVARAISEPNMDDILFLDGPQEKSFPFVVSVCWLGADPLFCLLCCIYCRCLKTQ